MTTQYIVVSVMLVFMLGMGISAVTALYWAARNGQFANMKENSKVIFDEAEEVGTITDAFPGAEHKLKPGFSFWLLYGGPIVFTGLIFFCSVTLAVLVYPDDTKAPAHAETAASTNP